MTPNSDFNNSSGIQDGERPVLDDDSGRPMLAGENADDFEVDDVPDWVADVPVPFSVRPTGEP